MRNVHVTDKLTLEMFGLSIQEWNYYRRNRWFTPTISSLWIFLRLACLRRYIFVWLNLLTS